MRELYHGEAAVLPDIDTPYLGTPFKLYRAFNAPSVDGWRVLLDPGQIQVCIYEVANLADAPPEAFVATLPFFSEPVATGDIVTVSENAQLFAHWQLGQPIAVDFPGYAHIGAAFPTGQYSNTPTGAIGSKTIGGTLAADGSVNGVLFSYAHLS